MAVAVTASVGMSILAVILTMMLVNFPSLFITSHYWLLQDGLVLNPRVDPIILLMPLSFYKAVYSLGELVFLPRGTLGIPPLRHWTYQIYFDFRKPKLLGAGLQR